MDYRYKEKLKALADAVLTTPGATTPELRRAVEARAAAMSGRSGADEGDVPDELRSYVDTVTTRAYDVTDDDIEHLLGAGYSEDAIFELTLSAALGAALARQERALSALYGETA